MDMRVLLLNLLILAIFSKAAASPYFAVVAPNAIRFGHDETVSVNVFGTNNQQFTVWLEHNGKKFSETQGIVASEDQPAIVTIRASEADIFDEETLTKAKHVTLKASCLGQVKEAELLVTYRSGYIIVQTDKPLYSPGQRVNFRVLALDEGLKHEKEAELLAIDIIDPKNQTVRRTRVNKPLIPFKDFYMIPEYAELRLWTIRAFFQGQYSTEARVTFSVEEYELPTFGVNVTTEANCLLEAMDDFKVDVKASYVYGKPVEGMVGLDLYLCNDKQGTREFVMSMQHKALDGGHNQFSVSVVDIMNSPAVQDDPRIDNFPSNEYHLEMEADVMEHVTGNEEKGASKVIFASSPYTFKFSKSRLSYRPGYIYTLQAQVEHANGKPVPDGMATVKMTKSLNNDVMEEVRPVEDGKVRSPFPTSQDDSDGVTLTFQVEFDGETSDKFVVSPYPGVDQVEIEMVVNQKKPELRISGNVQGKDRYTGIMLMIIARGNIIKVKHYEVALKLTYPLENDLLEKISPSARAIVFYIEKNSNNVISDSVYFEVTPKCGGAGLKLEPNKDLYRPGGKGNLELKGVPHMIVSLNAMDTALLLLNNDNILQTNTMFKMMNRHDLGCGAGGGTSSSDVFKNAGVVVLTNAAVNNVRRESIVCDVNRRKKRSADECGESHFQCCWKGMEYGMEIAEEKRMMMMYDFDDGVDLKTKCYATALAQAKNRTLPTGCINQYLRFCLEAVQEEEAEYEVDGKSLGDESDYEMDIRILNEGSEIEVRKNFQETWLFEDVSLDNDGFAEKELLIPDSITTWRLQGIGFSPQKGVCIAEPVDVKGYKDFFIQLDLPYKAVRLENVNIKASIFNYYEKDIEVNVYIEGTDGVCSSAQVGRQSPRQKATIPGNSAANFNFLVLPLRAGRFPITITALAKMDGVNQVDGVMKNLYVVNEGKEEHESVHVCLSPLGGMPDCENDEEVYKEDRVRGEQTLKIRLSMPEKAVPNTGHAVGYIKSNIMTDVVEKVITGTESMLRMPTGCGEQTMLGLAPTVSAMSYLKQTKQVNVDIETRGNEFIRKGVEREKTYRKDDGSYAAWKSRASSTWLTAFVAKIFCQAQRVVDDIETGRDVTPTLNWLQDKHINGEFFDALPVIHREMIGQMNEKDPSLTAFVIISFLECDGRTNAMNQSVTLAMRYLEGISKSDYNNNPYLLAITTYALAMADSPMKWDFMKMLKAKVNKDGEKLYWGAAGAKPASAEAVETTSYALLAYLTFSYTEESAHIVRWLIQQREGQGAFKTTMDTVVGLQALSEYSIRTEVTDTNLQVEFLNVGKKGKDVKKFNVTNENAQVVQVVDGLHRGDGEMDLTLRVKGSGTAHLTIDMTYNVQDLNEQCPFTVSDIVVEDLTDKPNINQVIGQERDCDVCGVCNKDVDNIDLDYDELFPDEVEPKGFGNKGLRRRRQARSGRQPRSTSKKYCVRFDVSSEKPSDMAIVNFGLETGVRVIKNDLDILLEKQPSIARYEMPPNGEGYIVFYLDSIGPEPVNFTFRLSDNGMADIDTRQMALVDIYEYYRPERQCPKFYGVGAQVGKPVPYECNAAKSRNCVCLQNICAKNSETKYTKILRRGGKPAIVMRNNICSSDNADYAVMIQMGKPSFDADSGYMTVTGELIKVIHQGKDDNMRDGEEMAFRYKAFCNYPKIKDGAVYYIIGKTGNKVPGTNTYKYELMDPTEVIKKEEMPKKKKGRRQGRRRPSGMMAVMNAFVKMMRGGCPT